MDRTTNTPVVILEEAEGDRVLPIWIGATEARAIATQMASMTFSRPLTHDLLCSIVGGLGGALQRVVVTDVEQSTYFAELVVNRGDEVVRIDARPSDSIAVALRADVPIFAEEGLLEVASIEVADAEPIARSAAETVEEERPESDIEELKRRLQAMDPEDFGRFLP